MKKAFTNFSSLRTNANGYFFVTLVNDKKANNVYFSKNADNYLKANYNVGERIDALLAKAEIAQVENQDGETRFKIVLEQSGDYASSSSMAELFGQQETVTDFNISEFLAEFAEEQAPAPVAVAPAKGKGKKTV